MDDLRLAEEIFKVLISAQPLSELKTVTRHKNLARLSHSLAHAFRLEYERKYPPQTWMKQKTN